MNEYTKQALDFLRDTATSIEILKAVPQKHPLWDDEKHIHGIHYSVTLKNDFHTYTFDFWDSYANAKQNKRPHAYDVLAALTKYETESYDNFCDAFGYDNDSIKALTTYKAVVNEWENLSKLFTAEELEKLAEIN